MKKIFISILLIISFLNLKGQTDSFPNNISFLTYWAKGDSMKYDIKKGKYKYKGESDEPTDSTIRNFRYLFVVKDSTEEGYLIEISLMPTLNNPDNALNGFIESLDLKEIGKLVKYNDFKIRYKIDPNGTFQKFENIDEIVKFHSDIWDLYIAKTVKNDNPEMKKMIQNLKNTMVTPEFIEAKTIQEIPQLHKYYGINLQVDTLYEYEEELPNFFEQNGKPIPSNNNFIINWTSSPEIAEIEGESELDSVIVKKLITQFLIKTLPNNKSKDNEKVINDIQNLSMTIKDYHYYSFHVPSGWVYEFVRTRRTKADDTINVEFFEMKMVLDDE
jgi:hypothetical protein